MNHLSKIFSLIILLIMSIPTTLAFRLYSPELDKTGLTNQHVAYAFGCTGKNQSPSLKWEDPPLHTKSFVLTMKDPDAPIQGSWTHWTIINIPASTMDLSSHLIKLPSQKTIETLNDFSNNSYDGPCPPINEKEHQYIFTLYALKTPYLMTGERKVTENDMPAHIEYLLNQSGMVIGNTSITYKYSRS